MRSIAIIPARGGSKGVPHKNIRLLASAPLLHYVIETCLKTSGVDAVAVSTDSDEIKDVVRKFNEVVIVDRPAALAADDTTSEDVLLHAIEYLEGKEGLWFETVLFAQATSPLTESDDFTNLLRKISEGYDSAAFYVEDFGFFFEEDDMLSPRLPRQMRKPRKREAGNGWAFQKDGFMQAKSRLFGRVGLCKINYPKNLEIDSESDIHIVERLLQLQEKIKRHSYYT